MIRACSTLFMIALVTPAFAEDRKAGAKPQSAQALTLPAGAKEVEPFTYGYTDAQGRKWVYRKTPFGLVRYEDKPGPVVSTRSELDSVTAAADGDNVSFVRQGPFGKYQWSRKKTEMTDFEKQVWQRATAAPQAPASAKE